MELAEHADLLVSPTTCADTAETILAAQRGGVPVLAVDGGAAAGLIENGRSGFSCPTTGSRSPTRSAGFPAARPCASGSWPAAAWP